MRKILQLSTVLFLGTTYWAAPAHAQGTMTTLFGTPWVFPDGVPALEAPISHGSVAVDRLGTIYIGDCDNGMAYRLDSQGRIVVVAGNGQPGGNSGDGGPARAASLFYPCGVSVDAKRNLYLSAGQKIRRVDLGGFISSLNAHDRCESSPDGTPASQASLGYPSTPVFDSRGLPYFGEGACGAGRKIRMFDQNGILRTVAGSGIEGFAGDGGPALQAQFRFSGDGFGMAFDGADNLYIADTNNYVIRRIDRATGIITTVAGRPGERAVDAPLGDGGPALQGRFFQPFGLSFDTGGNLYVADFGRVRRVSTNGILSTVAGNGGRGFTGDGGPATNATLEVVRSIAINPTNNDLLISSGRRVRRVRGGVITTIAGNDRYRFAGDGGRANLAVFNTPTCIFHDRQRDATYVCDGWNSRIRRVDASGNITTVAGTPDAVYPPQQGALALQSNFGSTSGVVVDSAGNIFATDVNAVRLHRIDAATGRVSILANFGTIGIPFGLAIDAQDNLYIGSATNHRIYRRTPGGQMTTFAGNGTAGFSGDGGPAANAQLNGPGTLAIDAQGRLFIGDEGNKRIRVVENGVIRTVAGNGQDGATGDGGPALSASFRSFSGLAVDGSGNLFVSDGAEGTMHIRRISPAGIVTRVAGTVPYRYEGDGGPANQAGLRYPRGLAMNNRDELLIADSGNHVVRAILPTRPAFGVEPRQLLFTVLNGEAPPLAQVLTVNGAPTQMQVTAQASGGDWLSVAPQAALTQATFFVSVSNHGLAPGTYNGQVTISSSNAVPSSVRVPVTLIVLPKTDISVSAGTAGFDLRSASSLGPRSAGTIVRGNRTTLVFGISNSGPDAAENVTITPQVPAGLTVEQAQVVGLPCEAQAAGGLFCPQLPVGATAYYSVVARASNSLASGSVVRPATSAAAETRETNEGNNRAEVAITVSEVAPPSVQLATQVVSGTGSIQAVPASPTGSYLQGEQVVLRAVPGQGCQFAGWAGAVVSNANPVVLTMDAAKSVQANFTCSSGNGLKFVPVTPCRLLETRSTYAGTTWTGPFGPPILAANQTRTLPVAGAGRCNIPASAKALALNITIDTVENNTGAVDCVTVWPTGQSRPNFCTLRTSTGGYIANAAIVKAGAGGSVDLFSPTNVHAMVDINGYFTDDPNAPGLLYYPFGPCRAVDTRSVYSTLPPPFGNSRMQAGETRRIHLPGSPNCAGLPVAAAYSLQMTLAPGAIANGAPVAFLTASPSGQQRPVISNMNALFGYTVANSGIVSADSTGAIDLYAPNATNVLLDVNGYFAPEDGTGRGLYYYPVNQCRAVDTADANRTGAYGAPQMTPATDRVVSIAGSPGCTGLPSNAKAWALNASVAPNGAAVPFLSMWPAGTAWPQVSQLNAFQGQTLAASGIVPAGPNGAVQMKVNGSTHVRVEVAGFFNR